MKQTVSVIVNNQPGVLQRVAGLFGRRGFNIESITVGESEEPGLSRMIIVTDGDESTVDQMVKQLYKLVDVIRVQNLSSHAMVARELVLLKVDADPTQRHEISGIVEPFRASIVDIGPSTMIIQATGDSDKIDALIELMRPYGIREISRTGITAMMRGLHLAKAQAN